MIVEIKGNLNYYIVIVKLIEYFYFNNGIM
uniref:Uncharacterized protein n=1 Tax=virus sp. ctE0n6 TaxID=2827985 RepID=A0A8S5RF22_9VIRU|nr:MAG TPA: hypothetical protein [virus sp. ctE0n6]